MNPEYVNPFIEATCEVFQLMLGCDCTRGQLRVAGRPNEQEGRTAIIGITGTLRGAVAVTFSDETASRVTAKLAQTDEVGEEALVDALGEIVNMIAGCAKAKIKGHNLDIGLPTVIRGDPFSLDHPKDCATVVVPFKGEVGDFSINITLPA